MPYSLRVAPRDPGERGCKHCGHSIPHLHRHAKCPGLQEEPGSCLVLHVSEAGVRKCAGARGYDIDVRIGFAGRRFHHARRDASGIYCQDCATRIAFQCNLSFKEEKSA